MSYKTKAVSLIPLYCLVLLFFLILGLIGNDAVTTIALQSTLPDRHCIVIDAGHGGIDGGTTSCTGILESTLNLEIALRLDDLIHLLGYDTVMIRTSDISVYTEGETIAQKKISDLKHRVKVVSETENALLISIHQNHFTDSQYKGAQVFYPATQGSDLFAKKMQTNLVSVLNPGSNRKCKKASGIYLIEHIPCTGLLIECGFLSNPEEEAKLRAGEYQKILCCVIAATVSEFLNA